MRIFKNWPRKISWKLTIVYATMFILVLLILNGAVYFILRNYLEDNIRESINNTIEFVLPKLTGLDRNTFNIYEADILSDISKSEGDIYFRILDYNREVIAQSNILHGLDIPVEPGYMKLNNGQRKYVAKSVVVTRLGFLNGFFQVVRDVTFEYRFLEVLLTILLFTSFVGSIGAIITGYMVTKKSLKPISQITRTAQNISVSDLGRRLKIEGPDDELNNLARTFNSMLDRLERSFKRQQQFVSDASHELRTPISVIQGYINLLDRWGKDEVEIRDEAIEAIKKETKNINNLLESLLFLARGDSNNLQINKSEFRMDEIIEEIVRESSLIANKIEVYSQRNDRVTFFGDSKMIKQLLRIFVDNSIKYTPAGGQIIINCINKVNRIELSVEDTGIGISEEEIPHIFNRFYRIDKSRSKGGAGLGLAIAKWIIDIHNGEVEVKSELGKGTLIIVSLPKDEER